MAEIIIPNEFVIGPRNNFSSEKTYNKHQKISFFQIPEWDEPLIKFSLWTNKKLPMESYKHKDKSSKSLLNDNCNVGLKTGAIAGFMVVDADIYKMTKDSNFLSTFEEEINNHFDTFCVKTPRGGYHYYFKYDSDVKQTQSKERENIISEGVDIRNDGGYVVFPPSEINGKAYKVVNDVPIIKISNKLKEWCIDKLLTKKKMPKSKVKSNKLYENEKIETTYDTVITSEDFEDILEKLQVDCQKEKDMRGSYDNWIQILKGAKFVGMKKEFIQWSKGTIHDNYDEKVLLELWRREDTTLGNFLFLLKKAKVRDRFTYKKVPPNNFKGFTEIKQGKLDSFKKKVKVPFFVEDTNYLTKSDPGTGKTTSFRNYVSKSQDPFISVTSRVSLSYDQFNSFVEEGMVVKHYEAKDFRFGDNIIITPESSTCISNYDFSKYIIFLDEFDSILNHVLNSSTVKKNRKDVFKNLTRMILTSKQFICADADISYISKYFLDAFKINYDFYINTFQNYENVKVNVIYDEEAFFDLIKQKDEYILCSDSKNDTDLSSLMLRLNDHDLFVITSDTEGNDWKLDDYKKILMSPKVLYGVNSVMRRFVFCHYNGSTISPSQMMQQICRCRDIIEVYIFFSDIYSKVPEFDDIDEIDNNNSSLLNNYDNVIKETKERISEIDLEDSPSIIFNETEITDDILQEHFEYLLKMDSYKQDCYNTNKFLHLLNILREKGFIINNKYEPLQKLGKKELKDQLQQEIEDNFDNKNGRVSRINQYLSIPEKDIEAYKELFIDKNKLARHFNISNYFFSNKTDNIMNLANRNDYDISKCKDINIKLDLLDKMLEKINLNKKELHSFIPTNTKLKGIKSIKEQYLKQFRIRQKDFKLETDSDMYKEISHVYKNLFGIVSSKKTRFGKNLIYLYSIDEDSLDFHKRIYDFRAEKKKEHKIIIPKKNIMKDDKPDKLMKIVKRTN